MPTPPGPQLRKVTLNLYEEDCQWMETKVGQGWSQWVRTTINAEIGRLKRMKPVSHRGKMTLGDFLE